MSKQGISTGSAPNDGTGDTLLAGTIKINNNFNEIYDIFGDGSNLVSFVSFATLLDILPTVVLHPHQFLLVLQRVLQITLISIHLVLLQQVMQMLVRLLFNMPGAIADGPIEVGTATTMFRIKADGMVGIGTSLPTSQLEVASFSNERPTIWAVAKGNGQGLRVSDAAISDNKSFVVTNEASHWYWFYCS